tara:strand:+ start:45022 stop:45612 length:591 start_codon:yes stop_codon:yes gene_type:complete
MPPSRRDELVDAAMKIFYRNGFHNTGLDQIQRESGISKMTLYNHFKSKDELILAALRRRDEIFRNQLMKHVDSCSKNSIEKIIAVFGYHEIWFNQDTFQGCMFINASAEYCDHDCPMRRVAADHKIGVVRYLRELCTNAGLNEPGELAEQLSLILEGSIVTAHVVGSVDNNDQTPTIVIRRATTMARKLIEDSRSD